MSDSMHIGPRSLDPSARTHIGQAPIRERTTTDTGERAPAPAANLGSWLNGAIDDVQRLRQGHTLPSPTRSALPGLDPVERALVVGHYNVLAGGDLEADARREPRVADDVQSFLRESARTQQRHAPPGSTKSTRSPGSLNGGAAGQATEVADTGASPPEVAKTESAEQGLSPDTRSFLERVRANFARWDKNKDGRLSSSELAEALRDPSVKGEDAAALATLIGRFADLCQQADDEWGRENGGISLADLEALGRAGGSEVDGKIANTWRNSLAKIRNTSGEVFNGEPDGLSVKQGSYGSCYFLASLVALARSNPEALKRMIQKNPDGTYTVTFSKGRTVTVEAPTDAEIARGATAGANGLWVTIIEKAYGKLRNDGSWLGKDDNPTDATNGGWLSDGIDSTTEGSTDTDMLVVTRMSVTRDKLVKALQAGKLVTCGIRKQLVGSAPGGLPDGHAYTVIGYNPQTDQITVRNPWGRSEYNEPDGKPRDGKDDGVFTLTLDEFYATFTNICYQE